MTSSSGAGWSAVRIGIETGPAVVGPIGGGTKVEYGAVGEVVGIAASLQSVARWGSFLVGPADTRAAAEGLFDWGPTEKVALITDTKPVVASYLERPKARGARRLSRLSSSAPLVGREAELALLDSALREAVRGQGSIVVLVGEAGLGKTRLVQECRKRFMAWVGAGTGRLPLWLEGRCASYASFTPYGLYQQLLAAWAGVATDQGEEVVRPALEQALSVVMGNSDLWPLLARMMGMAGGAGLVRLGPEELQRATFSTMGSVVSRLVAIGPTVLVLENMSLGRPHLIVPQHRARRPGPRRAPPGTGHPPAPSPWPGTIQLRALLGHGSRPPAAQLRSAPSLKRPSRSLPAPWWERRNPGSRRARRPGLRQRRGDLAFRSALEIADKDGSNNEVMARAG